MSFFSSFRGFGRSNKKNKTQTAPTANANTNSITGNNQTSSSGSNTGRSTPQSSIYKQPVAPGSIYSNSQHSSSKLSLKDKTNKKQAQQQEQQRLLQQKQLQLQQQQQQQQQQLQEQQLQQQQLEQQQLQQQQLQQQQLQQQQLQQQQLQHQQLQKQQQQQLQPQQVAQDTQHNQSSVQPNNPYQQQQQQHMSASQHSLLQKQAHQKPSSNSQNQMQQNQSETQQAMFLSEPFVRTALVKGSFKTIVQLPKYVDLKEWVALNVFEFYTNLNQFYGVIVEYVTPEAYPTMNAGPNTDYLWLDANNRQISLPANQYIDLALSWISNKISDKTLFPTQGDVSFPPNFPRDVQRIVIQLFRIFAHIYHHHFDKIVHLSLEAHWNSFFAHFISFCNEYNIIDRKEIYPLLPLVESFEKQGKII